MAIIKAVRDGDSTAYCQMGDLERLINYAMDPGKTFYNDIILNQPLVLSGFTGFIPEADQHSPETVFALMSVNKELYDKTNRKMLKHRVISFGSTEYVTPLALYYLGLSILEFYFSEGFIGCFGVHMNTDDIHLHYIIDTVNVFNGNRLQGSEDIASAISIVNAWYKDYCSANLAFWDPANKLLFESGNFKDLTVNDLIHQQFARGF